MLPLVCMAWQEAICKPSSLWQRTAVDIRLQPSQPVISDQAVRSFFASRAAAIESLALILPEVHSHVAVSVMHGLAVWAGPGNQLQIKRLCVDTGLYDRTSYDQVIIF